MNLTQDEQVRHKTKIIGDLAEMTRRYTEINSKKNTDSIEVKRINMLDLIKELKYFLKTHQVDIQGGEKRPKAIIKMYQGPLRRGPVPFAPPLEYDFSQSSYKKVPGIILKMKKLTDEEINRFFSDDVEVQGEVQGEVPGVGDVEGEEEQQEQQEQEEQVGVGEQGEQQEQKEQEQEEEEEEQGGGKRRKSPFKKRRTKRKRTKRKKSKKRKSKKRKSKKRKSKKRKSKRKRKSRKRR